MVAHPLTTNLNSKPFLFFFQSLSLSGLYISPLSLSTSLSIISRVRGYGCVYMFGAAQNMRLRRDWTSGLWGLTRIAQVRMRLTLTLTLRMRMKMSSKRKLMLLARMLCLVSCLLTTTANATSISQWRVLCCHWPMLMMPIMIIKTMLMMLGTRQQERGHHHYHYHQQRQKQRQQPQQPFLVRPLRQEV